MTNPRDPSRRDFIAASTISLIGLARGSESPALRDEANTDGDLLYVGTYTADGRSEGIYLVRMDRRSGLLRRVGSVDAGANPSSSPSIPTGAFFTPSTSSRSTRADRLVRRAPSRSRELPARSPD